MGEGCATCCAVYSVLGIALLLLFGGMFSQGAVTLHVIALKNDWSMEQKANACFKAAAIYAVTLGLSVLGKVYYSRQKSGV